MKHANVLDNTLRDERHAAGFSFTAADTTTIGRLRMKHVNVLDDTVRDGRHAAGSGFTAADKATLRGEPPRAFLSGVPA